MKKYYLFLVFSITFYGIWGQTIIKDQKKFEQIISEIIGNEIKNSNIPSLQVAINYEGSLVFSKAFGWLI